MEEVLDTLEGQLDEKAQVALELTIEDEALRALLPLASAAAGGDLIDVAAANGDLARKLNRALTVTVKNGDVFTFSASV